MGQHLAQDVHPAALPGGAEALRNRSLDVLVRIRRTFAAGFDGIELHGAPGFLIPNCLSPRFNQRADQRGGSLAIPMRFPFAVVAEVKHVATPYR